MRRKLLQIAIGWLITNCDKILLQIPRADLWQIAAGLLQIAIGIVNCYKFITNCDSYYKLRRLLQIATEQSSIEWQEASTWWKRSTRFDLLNLIFRLHLPETIYRIKQLKFKNKYVQVRFKKTFSNITIAIKIHDYHGNFATFSNKWNIIENKKHLTT